MSVDGNGVSGTFDLGTSGYKVFGLTVNGGKLSFDRDVITGGGFSGALDVPSFGTLTFGVGISQNGANVALQLSKGLSWPGLGKLNVTSGGGSIDKNNKVTFNLSGDVTLDLLKDIDLGFNDLQIDSEGHISANELSLAKPVSIPLFGLTLTANKMVYKTSPTSLRIDGDIKFLRQGAGGHEILHLAHHVRHVLRVVLVEMLHVALHLAHGALDARIVEVGHRRAVVAPGLRGGFLQALGHREAAHLLTHLFVPALRANGQAVRVDALREEIENHPALRAGELVDRHNRRAG